MSSAFSARGWTSGRYGAGRRDPSRLRDLASAEESFKGFAEGIGKAHADFIPKAEGRLTKKGFAHGGRVSATDLEVQRRVTDLRVKAALRVKPHIDRRYDTDRRPLARV